MTHWDVMAAYAPAARPKLGTVPPGDPRDRGGKAQPMLIASGLTKHFDILGGVLNRPVAKVRAVDGVSFSVLKGETLGIVGESGCGKSTLARLLMHLIPMDSGELIFDGEGVGETETGGAGLDRLRTTRARDAAGGGARGCARAARQGRPRSGPLRRALSARAV